MLLNIFLLLVPFRHLSKDLIVHGAGGKVKIFITGRDTCNINNKVLGGPNLSSSLEIVNQEFQGCNCQFTLPSIANYDYIVLYLNGHLKDNETITFMDSDNEKLVFNTNNFKDDCIYMRSPLQLTYSCCLEKGDLDLYATWASGEKCDKGSCYSCSMSHCYKHHSVVHRKLYIRHNFFVTDHFKNDNCPGKLLPGWIAFIVVFCALVVLIVVLIIIYKRRKGKKPTFTLPLPSYFSSYPVITPSDLQNRSGKVTDSVFTTSGDMPIDSSNAYSRFDNSLDTNVIYR